MISENRESKIDIPPQLRHIQENFAMAIRMPFSFSSGKFACQVEQYPDEAVRSIHSRGDENPENRLAVYNEQYWYRLLTTLQKDFPLLAYRMGFWHFNQLATAYLTQYPSRSPYLEKLPNQLPTFMGEKSEWGQKFWIQAANLDFAFFQAFHLPEKPVLDIKNFDTEQWVALSEKVLSFQPWLFLIEEDWNGMQTRAALVNADDHEPGIKVEAKMEKGYWAIFRQEGHVSWLSLEFEAFVLLRELHSGSSLSDACEKAAQALDEAGQHRLATGITEWFAYWIKQRWICDPSTATG